MALWLAFGATGLATGAVWATGFAEVGSGNSAQREAPVAAKTAPEATTALTGTVTDVDPIEFEWDGRWGKITAPKVMFEVDLTGAKYTGRTYNVAMLLANGPALVGWSSLQLEFEQVAKGPGGTCAASDFDGSQNAKLLYVDDADAGVYWNGLAGNDVYCLGIAASDGNDYTDGTFLRASQDADDTTEFPTGHPSFITTVDRAS